MKAYDTVFN
jgi:hypothetical protein